MVARRSGGFSRSLDTTHLLPLPPTLSSPQPDIVAMSTGIRFSYIRTCIYDQIPEDWTRLSSPHQFPTRTIGLAFGKVFPYSYSLRSRIVTDSRSIGVTRTRSQSYQNRIFVIRAGTSAEIRTHLHLKATPDHRPHTTLHSTPANAITYKTNATTCATALIKLPSSD